MARLRGARATLSRALGVRLQVNCALLTVASRTTPHIVPHILHQHYAHTTSVRIPLSFLPPSSTADVALAAIGRDLQRFPSAGRDGDRICIKRNVLINFSGKKTGRSPKGKRIVYEETSKDDVWRGPVNIKMDAHTFEIPYERAIDYLNTRNNVYIFDGYAGWDPKCRTKAQVICARAYHALFVNNALIRSTEEQLAHFGESDFISYNAGRFPANHFTKGTSWTTPVEINFKRMELVILGAEYAGEMKKGVFSIAHYLQPVKFGQLSLHSVANVGVEKNKVTLVFGFSGTGKTTLSTDPKRPLIDDDEHVWSATGVFNIEGGCYAKCINLSAEKAPEIFNAIKFGGILENVAYDPATRVPDYDDVSFTENTRCAYPIEFIPNAQIPCSVDRQPSNIITLTCDAFNVLPPVSKLTPAQGIHHFLAGYVSKTPGVAPSLRYLRPGTL